MFSKTEVIVNICLTPTHFIFFLILTVCTRSPLLEWHIVLVILGILLLVAGIVLTIFLTVIAVCYSKCTKNGAVCKMEYNFKVNDLLTHVKPSCAGNGIKCWPRVFTAKYNSQASLIADWNNGMENGMEQ